ncbi:hypothetical protein L226DRAFT_533378 [Lentinus tigrinus ALCF2SS1-7]|uniref:MYND-type domain-containing protein n=1 Tax=Lentinus tigrinus ALCF2SS1-6 TaxID=1328759 RepID=A0A5C2SRR2_9APHY|nr:hypothetical protein L227DRAFT_571635 [Lentinus tigrinus ALCF2SS1-6]RPD76268.1 hypothetical protein L226DRAFT_533378 [Lentinus tigrinus ALCF2SS1-7]
MQLYMMELVHDNSEQRHPTLMDDSDDEEWFQVPRPSTHATLRIQEPSTYCHSCGTRGVKVRRCSGCAVACYCSRECQKTAWPAHKHWCRESDRRGPETSAEEYADPWGPQYRLQNLKESPFPTRIAAITSFGQFMQDHVVATTLMMEAAAYLLVTGGHFEELQAGVPHVAVFHVEPRRDHPEPGRTWRVRSFGIRPADNWVQQYPLLEVDLPKTLEAHSVVSEVYKAELGSKYCATLITAYHLLESTAEIGQIPVYAPRDPGVLEEQLVVDALHDIIQLCIYAIRYDVVLPPPTLEDKIFVASASVPSRYRKKKSRKSNRVAVTLDTVYGRLVRAGYTPRSTMSPTQMMNLLAEIQS